MRGEPVSPETTLTFLGSATLLQSVYRYCTSPGLKISLSELILDDKVGSENVELNISGKPCPVLRISAGGIDILL